MKKRLIVLTTVLILSMVLTGTVIAKNAKAGAEKLLFYHAADVLACPRYCYNRADGATGKLIVNQPNGEVSVVLTANFDGLEPNNEYTVYVMNLDNPGAPGWISGGIWTGDSGDVVGTFITDMYGHGDYHLNIGASELVVGTYHFSVWVNDNGVASGNKTLFVSDNFDVVIE
jgi:hypothetical protein